jgi:hypothetical protein
MREFISPVLVGGILLGGGGLKLVSEKRIQGGWGSGPVDYVAVYKHFDIILTEAKKEDVVGGIRQNIAQQVAGREHFARTTVLSESGGATDLKRKYDDILSDIEDVPSCGIVTTGDEWIFLSYTHKAEGYRLVKSVTYPLSICSIATEDLRRSQLQCLLLKIGGVLRRQMDAVDYFHTKKQGELKRK